MSRLLLTAAVLAVLVYTMVLGVRWLSPRIEQDIAERVTTGLAEQGLLWADVAVEGRDVVLSGTAPDAEAKDRALNVVTRVFGVSKVTDNLTVVGDVSNSTVAMVSGTVVSGTTVSDTKVVAAKVETKAEKKVEAAKAAAPVADYALTITKDGEKVALEGNVPDEASKKVLVELATNRYTAENVDSSKLVVVDGAPAGWRSAVGAVLMHISNMEQAKVLISGTEVMVSGSVLDKQYSDKMEQDVSEVLPKSYKAAFSVDVVTPTVPDVAPAAGDEVSGTDVSATAVTANCDSKVELGKQTLMFGFDKADLTAEHKARIKTVAGQMKSCATEKVVLAGYTDVTGSKLYNKWLSQQRAEAAMRGLMRDGVAKARLKAIGYGELYPVSPNTTKASRAKNRRVEFNAGDTLPHDVNAQPSAEAKAVAAPVKTAAPAKHVKVVKTVSKTVIKTVKPAVVSGTEAVSDSAAIAKPWWARKKVSETAVDAQ